LIFFYQTHNQLSHIKKSKHMTLGYFSFQAVMVLFLVQPQRIIIPKANALLLPSASVLHYNHHLRLSRCTLSAIESRELRFFNASPVIDGIVENTQNDNSISRNNDNENGVNGMKVDPSSNLPFFATLTGLDGNNNNNNEYFFAALLDQFPKSTFSLNTRRTTATSSKIPSRGSIDNAPTIKLTKEEEDLFELLRTVNTSTSEESTLRVAGGWVRDKLLAEDEFQRSHHSEIERLTSKYKEPSMGRQGSKIIGVKNKNAAGGSGIMRYQSLIDPDGAPVDIDVALDDMLGREFADSLNDYLTLNGREKVPVGMVLKNPEKSKHLETATMKVGTFWVDFVNLRAEEYTTDSRIPDQMRIGTAVEDAYRRDLTINALFYNILTGRVEDLTGRGFDHLRRGIIATPLPALTTLLDDPLRVLRSIRFAARLRFRMDDDLRNAAQDRRVRVALAQKVARERIGGEVDLMLRSQDPVGAMRLLVNLKLVETVFPSVVTVGATEEDSDEKRKKTESIFTEGLDLLSTTHNHLCDCKANIPFWCDKERAAPAAKYFGINEVTLIDDEDARRRLWYAAFLKPLSDHVQAMNKSEKEKVSRRQGKKANRSTIMKLMVDELKRSLKDAEAVEMIIQAADDFTNLLRSGCDISSTACILGDIRVIYHGESEEDGMITCHMAGRKVDSDTEDDPLWLHAMEYRLLVSKVLGRIGPLWRAALILSLSEELLALEKDDMSYTIEGDVFEETHAEKRKGIIQKYDSVAATMLQLGLIGIWSQDSLIDGREMLTEGVLPKTPRGPVFREIMDEQASWITTHPSGSKECLIKHLQEVFPEFV